jgi:UDP-N-acetylglucosamine 4,6-dehydratase/5-epimerase
MMDGATVTIAGGTGSFGSTMVSHLLTRAVNAVHILSRDEAKQNEMRNSFFDVTGEAPAIVDMP